MQTTISLIDLVNALEATSRGLEWRVDLVTGDVIASEEESHSPVVGGRFRALPTNGALGETEIRREFCAKVKDEGVQRALSSSIETNAFFDHARRADVLDDWLVHRRSCLVNVALEWAAAEDVPCRRDLTPASVATG